MKLNTAIYAYGTSEGVSKEWDERGRGRRRFAWNKATPQKTDKKQSISTLQEHVEEHAKEGNGKAAVAFATARAALVGVKQNRADAESADSILREHLDDAIKDNNKELTTALVDGLAALGKYR